MSPALCPILPKHVYGDGTDLENHPRNSVDVIGSGPFRLAEFKPGQRVVLERFDKLFLAGRPQLDKIIVSITADTQRLVLGAERGDVQLLPYISGSVDLKRLGRVPGAARQAPLIGSATLAVGAAILFEAGLSFLCLSDPNVMSWGLMICSSRPYVLASWWSVAMPDAAIFLTVLAVSLVGDGLNEALNPRSRQS